MKRVNREARLRWVPIADMRVNPVAQRELRDYRVDRLVANFDLEQIGTPTVNERDGVYYVIDGQHRIEALKRMGWVDQQIQVWCYVGLTEQEEAEKFLKLNDSLAVDAFSKFKTAVTAGREMEVDIDRIVRAQGLNIGRHESDGTIRAVGKLQSVYNRGGAETLGRTLRIVRDSFGDPGLEGLVIDGIGLLCSRYNGELDEKKAIEKLSAVRGGVNGVLGRAETLHRATGNAKAHCVAAAAVEAINRGKGGKKLPDWWVA